MISRNIFKSTLNNFKRTKFVPKNNFWFFKEKIQEIEAL